MSVVPKQDALVMSFAEATRVFNADQSNLGSSVPGTGDASHQAPYASRRQSSYGPNTPAGAGASHAHPYAAGAHGGAGSPGLGRGYSQSGLYPPVGTTGAYGGSGQLHSEMGGEGPERPHEVAGGVAAVVPAAVPTQQQVAANPDQMVEIRNPNVDNVIVEEEEEHYSNPWFTTRAWMRVYFAEFLGTMILVAWGEGTQAQVVAARKVPDDYLSISWGWGVGFMLAIYVSSGISGGHINPAVTISLAVFRKFPWRRVPGYIAAQLLGAFTAAAIIFGVYYGPLHSLATGYAGVMTTGPADLVPSVASTFFSVFTGAALLMGSIAAFTDTGNNPATPGLTPLLLGLVMVGIASSFGYQTGFVLNPARDLGPRLLVWATGEGGRALWLDNAAYGIWVPTVATIAGALFANLMYDLLIYTGRDSPVNFNFSSKGRRARKLNQARGVEHNPGNFDWDREYEKAKFGGQPGKRRSWEGDVEAGGHAQQPRFSNASGRTAVERY